MSHTTLCEIEGEKRSIEVYHGLQVPEWSDGLGS